MKPGVYTRVTHYIEWIQQKTNGIHNLALFPVFHTFNFHQILVILNPRGTISPELLFAIILPTDTMNRAVTKGYVPSFEDLH